MKLVELLDGCAAHAPEYGHGLSNHLPMSLVALQRLGASDARLQEFADRYAARLQAAPAAEPWPPGDAWPPRLGEVQAWPAYRSLFAEWIAQEGGADMLGQVLPQLMPGVGAAAFHGLIRTAYAARCGHRAELADALAYWACRHLRLGEMGDPLAGRAPASTTDDPVALLRELRASPSTADLIFERMRQASLDDRINRVAARLYVDGQTLQRLARAAAYAYARSGNFVALHLLTSAHAMRLLSNFIDEPLTACAWYWQAYAHAVAAAGLKPAPAEPRLRPWKTLIERAIASDDEHVIKVVDSCREEEKAYARRGETLWREAASRAVG